MIRPARWELNYFERPAGFRPLILRAFRLCGVPSRPLAAQAARKNLNAASILII